MTHNNTYRFKQENKSKKNPNLRISLVITTILVFSIISNALAMQVAALAVDINSGSSSSSPRYLTEYNGKLYFQADGNDGHGKELWVYDGTNASLVVDILSGAASSNVSNLAVYNGKLYFQAYSDAYGSELWVYDSNTNTASLAANICSGNSGSVPSYLAAYNGKLYFSANGCDGAGSELWSYDGNSASRVADIYSGSTGSNPKYLTVYDGALYFSATASLSISNELYFYDGSTVSLAVDIEDPGGSIPEYLAAYDGKLYFSAASKDDGRGKELWAYDGSSANLVADIRSGMLSSYPAYLTVFDNKLFFAADSGDLKGKELWSFDGSTAVREADINGGFNAGSFPEFLAVAGDELFFSADGGDGAGRELWHFYEDAAPQVGTTSPANGASISSTTTLQVFFSEDVKHDGSSEAANITANYVLVEEMGDGFQTTACNATDFTSDLQITIDQAVYSNNSGAGPFEATLSVNNGTILPEGSYRLLVCGTTSIEDMVGNKLNNGADQVVDFTVTTSVTAAAAELPKTGFAPGVVTAVDSLAIENAYTDLGSLWLEIPRLDVNAVITGIPVSGDGWDVSWLGNKAGWLEGTSFPTHTGNSALSAHAYDANGQPGIFSALASLKWGDEVIVHYGMDYVYEVRKVNEYVRPDAIDLVLQHEDYPWLTLITCRGYDAESNSYAWRVVVQAVQVRIE
jgi:LPXTG-site transpeptidase (sortase) family protein